MFSSLPSTPKRHADSGGINATSFTRNVSGKAALFQKLRKENWQGVRTTKSLILKSKVGVFNHKKITADGRARLIGFCQRANPTSLSLNFRIEANIPLTNDEIESA
jgi:hypothetical protein